jgi:hypothetical protein
VEDKGDLASVTYSGALCHLYTMLLFTEGEGNKAPSVGIKSKAEKWPWPNEEKGPR